MLYLLTRTFNTATWFYRGALEEGMVLPKDARVSVPTGIAVFPGEPFVFPPRSLVERSYDVVRWTAMPRGGHFAAMEMKGVFAEEVLAFLGQVEVT